MALPPTGNRPKYNARLQTSYFNTTGQCLELYFRSRSPTIMSSTSIISVFLVSEEQDETLLVASNGLEPGTQWNRMFTVLPGGVFQVVIEGRRSSVGISSLAIDDIIIQPCSKFGMSLYFLQ